MSLRIETIDSVMDQYQTNGLMTKNRVDGISEASAMRNPVDMAKAQVHAGLHAPGLTSFDGITTIGSVSVKGLNAVKAISAISSSWGVHV